MSQIQLIKSIRERTGLSLKEIKKAVENSSSGNEDQIIDELRKSGILKQKAREGRDSSHGSIFTYNHEGKIGVLLEIRCETDFVAKSEALQSLGNDIVLHIAAYEPSFLSPEEADSSFIDKEVEIIQKQLEEENKPQEVINKIIEGKKSKILSQSSLLTQPFIKDSSLTVKDKITEICQLTGENIYLSQFKILKLS
jgi:elongation factor Ts